MRIRCTTFQSPVALDQRIYDERIINIDGILLEFELTSHIRSPGTKSNGNRLILDAQINKSLFLCIDVQDLTIEFS